MSRFSEAISEGDGISVIPSLAGDVAALAAAAEAAGAEAVLVTTSADVERVRAAVGVPVLVRERVRDPHALNGARAAGADAFVLVFAELADDGELLEELHAEALDLDFDCALEVRDDEELGRALERLDPDIVLLSGQDAERGDDELEQTLDLLPDVPAGKLVIAEGRVVTREQVLALERAGIDAIVVQDLARSTDFASAVEELVGGPRPGR